MFKNMIPLWIIIEGEDDIIKSKCIGFSGHIARGLIQYLIADYVSSCLQDSYIIEQETDLIR